MRYLCLLIGEPGIEGPVPGTPEFAQMLSDYESATRAMAGDGALEDSGPLQSPATATTVRIRAGRAAGRHRRAVRRDQGAARRLLRAASAPTSTRRCWGGGSRPPAAGRSRYDR